MRLNSNMKGAILMTACVFAYVINDAFMKALFSEIAFFQAIFLRSIIIVPPVLFIAWVTKIKIRNLSAQNKRLMLVRVIAEIFTIDVTAVLLLSVLMALGLLKPEEAIAGLSNPAVITIALLFVLLLTCR